VKKFKGEKLMGFTLRGARLVDASTDLPAGDIIVDGEKIQSVGATLTVAGKVIDVSGMIVTPGFIDVHTHGGGGFELHTTKVEQIYAYSRWVASTGVTSYLVAVVGTPNCVPVAQMETAVQAIEHQQDGAEPLGIHLEGPYINVKKRGAHPPEWLRIPDPEETEEVLRVTNGHLRLVTLAPELPGAPEMIKQLVEAQVTVSMGHTEADYQQAKDAFAQGITHVTHCFNAMRPMLHREPGPLPALFEAPKHVKGELIPDGYHVDPAMMRVLVKLLGPDRTIIVTDAQAGAGIPDAVFEFAGQTVYAMCGAARFKDGTLAGSILTLDKGLHNVLELTGVNLQEAITMMTLNPAQSIHVDSRKGLLKTGYDADLLLFDSSLTLQATICRGRIIYATEDWRERFL
jgi:N-acetylglucosamine-6-phosphate deacetylase